MARIFWELQAHGVAAASQHTGRAEVLISAGASITVRCDDAVHVQIGTHGVYVSPSSPLQGNEKAEFVVEYTGETHADEAFPLTVTWRLENYGSTATIEIDGFDEVLTDIVDGANEDDPKEGEEREFLVRTVSELATKKATGCVFNVTSTTYASGGTIASKNGDTGTANWTHTVTYEKTVAKPEIKVYETRRYSFLSNEWVAVEGTQRQEPTDTEIAANYPKTESVSDTEAGRTIHFFLSNTGAARTVFKTVVTGLKCNDIHKVEFNQAAYSTGGGGGGNPPGVNVGPGTGGGDPGTGGGGGTPGTGDPSNPGEPGGEPFLATPQTQYKPKGELATRSVTFTGTDKIPVSVLSQNCTAGLDGTMIVPADADEASAFWWNASGETTVAYVFAEEESGTEPGESCPVCGNAPCTCENTIPGCPVCGNNPCTCTELQGYLKWQFASAAFGAEAVEAGANRVLTNLSGELEFFATGGGDWLTWSASGNELSYTLSENLGEEARTASITARNVESELEATFTIVQDGRDPMEPPQDYLKWQFASAAFGAEAVEAGANRVLTNLSGELEFFATGGGDWLTWSANGNELIYALSENSEEEARTASITARNVESELEATFTIEQDGQTPTEPFLEFRYPAFNISAERFSGFTANPILTNTDWNFTTASEGATGWLEFSLNGFTVSGGNTAIAARAASFTVSHAGSGLSASYTVTQSGVEPFLNLPFSTGTVIQSPGEFGLAIYTNCEAANLSAESSSPDWLTAEIDGGRLVLKYATNTALTSRTATVTVRESACGLEARFTLTQLAQPLNSCAVYYRCEPADGILGTDAVIVAL